MPLYQCHVSNKILISCHAWSLMGITLYVGALCFWVGQLSLSVAKNKMGKSKRSYRRWLGKWDNSESILSSLLESQVIPPPVLETAAVTAQGCWNARRHPMPALTSVNVMKKVQGKENLSACRALRSVWLQGGFCFLHCCGSTLEFTSTHHPEILCRETWAHVTVGIYNDKRK